MGEQHRRLRMPVCGTTCTLRWFPKGDPYLLLQVSVCRFSNYWIGQWLEFKHFSLLSRNSTTVISYEISITLNLNSLCPPFHLQFPLPSMLLLSLPTPSNPLNLHLLFKIHFIIVFSREHTWLHPTPQAQLCISPCDHVELYEKTLS